MNRRLLSGAALAWGLLAGPLTAQLLELEDIEFQAADGVVLRGYGHIQVGAGEHPILLLFHQDGHNARAEYTPLIPRLVEAGFDIVAMDLRRGGDRFGDSNRTVEGLGERVYSYCDAYQDLEATLAFVKEQVRRLGGHRPIVAWGSSFSAALVLKLAAEYPDDVMRVLAFSPASGEPMAGCDPSEFSADVAVPGLILRPASEMEIFRIGEQMGLFETLGFETYVADPGVHGSSMLNADRVGGSTEATWDVVLGFLAAVR